MCDWLGDVTVGRRFFFHPFVIYMYMCTVAVVKGEGTTAPRSFTHEDVFIACCSMVRENNFQPFFMRAGDWGGGEEGGVGANEAAVVL